MVSAFMEAVRWVLDWWSILGSLDPGLKEWS